MHILAIFFEVAMASTDETSFSVLEKITRKIRYILPTLSLFFISVQSYMVLSPKGPWSASSLSLGLSGSGIPTRGMKSQGEGKSTPPKLSPDGTPM